MQWRNEILWIIMIYVIKALDNVWSCCSLCPTFGNRIVLAFFVDGIWLWTLDNIIVHLIKDMISYTNELVTHEIYFFIIYFLIIIFKEKF